jgi:hypothetical protein
MFEAFVIDDDTQFLETRNVLGRAARWPLTGDHNTVINADRKIRSLMAESPSMYIQLTKLTKQQARAR